MTNSELIQGLQVVEAQLPGPNKKALALLGLALMQGYGNANDVTNILPLSAATVREAQIVGSGLPGGTLDTAIVFLLYQLALNNSTVLDSGVATLSSGAATVNTPYVKAANPVILTYYSLNNNAATIRYGSVVDGVSFVITSTNNSDSNKVSWAVIGA